MVVLVCYDVSTVEAKGRRRLRKVARLCENYGQRVQNSVFKCLVAAEDWVVLRSRLLDLYDSTEDSLRFYFLGNKWRNRVEHHGIKTTLDPEGPLVA